MRASDHCVDARCLLRTGALICLLKLNNNNNNNNNYNAWYRQESADDELECVLPDLSAFCSYVRGFALSEEDPPEVPEEEHVLAVRQMEKEFIIHQLIQITHSYDLSDEVTPGHPQLISQERGNTVLVTHS